MAKLRSILITFFSILFFVSCVKTDTLPPTELKILVTDDQGYAITGANVTLYTKLSDFENDVNPVVQTVTDAYGYIHLYNLSPLAYYLYIYSGCLDNYNGTIHLSQPLVANTLNTYDPIALYSVGEIKLTNNSGDPYEVYLDGSLYDDNMLGFQTLSIPELPTGSHSIEVVQLSGYQSAPIDETFKGSITCGSTVTLSFP